MVNLDDPADDIEVKAGGGLVVPTGMWHRVDVLAPSRIAYVTPETNNEFRPLSKHTRPLAWRAAFNTFCLS